jgi:SAM-dependent methyltransferase
VEKDEYRRLFELEDQFWWFVGMREISLKLLDRYLPPNEKRIILDAGCGTGGMLPHLSHYGSTVGVDLFPEALEYAGRRTPKRLARASVTRLPFAGETFDLVTSFDVIYHRAVGDDEQALAETARVIRPGGHLLIRVPAFDRLRSRHDEAVHTERRYSREELVEKLQRAGLQPVYTTYANFFLFPAAIAKRLSERLFPRRKTGSEVQQTLSPLNALFTYILKLELKLIKRVKLPTGLSLIAIARRPSN